MFSPNLEGILRKRTGRDIHGRHLLGPELPCPFGPINLMVGASKTTVRADSSASRGAADETTVERGRILTPEYVGASTGDIFAFNDIKYEIASVHPRYSTSGALDHFECDMELYQG